MNKLMKTKAAPVLGDLLPYIHFESEKGLLWLKDGSATTTYRITPKSSLSMTGDELEMLRSSLSETLNQLPEGGMLQFYFVRERTHEQSDQAARAWSTEHFNRDVNFEDSSTGDLFTSKSEQVRSRWGDGSLFQSKIYLTLRLPPEIDGSYGHRNGPLSFITSLKSKKEKKVPRNIESETLALSQSLKLGLESQGFEVSSPNSKELVDFIFRFLNPERAKSMGTALMRDSEFLSESLALTDLVESRDGLSLGGTHIKIGSLKSYPESSTPALMTGFACECESFFLVYTILSLSQAKEKERLSRKQRLATGMAGGNHVRNLQAESQLQDIEDTLSAMISSGEKLFASSLHLMTSSESEAGTKTTFNRLLECGERLGGGCQWFEETVGAYPVFFGILPFAPTFLIRPKRLLSQNVSDFLPVYGIGPGHREASALFETPYQSLIGYSLFERSPSGNGIVLGESGSGKSTLVCGLLLGANAGASPRAPAGFVIDVGNSFKRSILYLGGASIDLSPENGITLNPFDLEVDQQRPDPEKVKFLTALFDEILGDAGNLSKLERALLETEILLFYESQSEWTFSNFKKHLEHSESIELKRLSKLLSLWCKPHPYGLLFDGSTNIDLGAPHIHFELKGCQRYPDLLRVAMLAVMEVIRRKIKERFPRRSFAIVDEAHTIIRPSGDGRTNSSARWVDDCFRQMRKFGSSAIAITQTAKDLKSDEIGDGILANAPNRFILKQRGDEKTLKEDLKLNPKELKEVFSLTQLRGSFSEFYLQSESIRGVFLYRPTPLELWLSTTHPPDLILLKRETDNHPNMDLRMLMKFMAETYPHGAPDNIGGTA